MFVDETLGVEPHDYHADRREEKNHRQRELADDGWPPAGLNTQINGLTWSFSHSDVEKVKCMVQEFVLSPRAENATGCGLDH